MASRVFRYAGRDWPDPRNTRAWRKLAAQVAREEPVCWLRLDGCTTKSTTADHVIPVTKRPDLAMVRRNLRGACHSCNNRRSDKPVAALTPATKAPALRFFD